MWKSKLNSKYKIIPYNIDANISYNDFDWQAERDYRLSLSKVIKVQKKQNQMIEYTKQYN